MTNKKIKSELRNLYQPPMPQHKREFCEQMRQLDDADLSVQISMSTFLLSQLRYIRPWGWIVSAVAFLAAWIMMAVLGSESVWEISALMPFVAVSLIAELHRSAHFRMDELEQATRFSLKAVTFARLCIMGISNLFLLILTTPLITHMCKISPVDAVVYLLVPYTATSFLCLLILRLWHRDEAIFACAAVSVGMSFICFLMDWLDVLTINSVDRGSVTLLLLLLMLMEYKKYLTGLEDLAWN